MRAARAVLTESVNALRGRGFRVEGMLCDVTREEDVQAVVGKRWPSTNTLTFS